MKLINIFVWILRIFGLLSIILVCLFLILLILKHALFRASLRELIVVLQGLVYLCLAQGLSREEKWAWDIGLTILILFTVFANSLIFAGINIFFIFLLVKGSKPFIEKPKEKISLWFRNPYFVTAVLGTVIAFLIRGGMLAQRLWQMLIW